MSQKKDGKGRRIACKRKGMVGWGTTQYLCKRSINDHICVPYTLIETNLLMETNLD